MSIRPIAELLADFEHENTGMRSLAAYACENNPEDAALMLMSDRDIALKAQWAFETACDHMLDYDRPDRVENPTEVFDLVLRVAKIVQTNYPAAKFGCSNFEFWSTPWSYIADTPAEIALHRACCFVETDEFWIDDSPDARKQLAELFTKAEAEGMSRQDLEGVAEHMLRGNRELAKHFGFSVEDWEPALEEAD